MPIGVPLNILGRLSLSLRDIVGRPMRLPLLGQSDVTLNALSLAVPSSSQRTGAASQA
jgi:hypothetical protein